MKRRGTDEDGTFYEWRFQRPAFLISRWLTRRVSSRLPGESYQSAGVAVHLGRGGRRLNVTLEREESGRLALHVTNMRGRFLLAKW